MKLNIQWKKVLYGIILIVISVLVILVGTYITLSEIKNCKQ